MSSKPRTPAQIAASRANGQKSLGATTPEGKCKTQTAHMTHGFRASHMAIHSEDHTQYNGHLDAYLHHYNPIGKVEIDLVSLVALNMWQVMRNSAIEVALFDLEVAAIDANDLDGQFKTMDQYGRLALAFKKSAGENVHELLRRYKTSAERAYHRALQAIENMQAARQSAAPQPEGVKITDPPKPPEQTLTQPSTQLSSRTVLQLVKPLENLPTRQIQPARPCNGINMLPPDVGDVSEK